MRAAGPEPAYDSWWGFTAVNSGVVLLGIQQLFRVASSPLNWISPSWEKARLGYFCKLHSQTQLHQESLSILRTGGALKLHVWSCTWKSNYWVLLAEKQGLSGRPLLNCSSSVLDLFMKHLHCPLFAELGLFLAEWRSKRWKVCASLSKFGESQPWMEELNYPTGHIYTLPVFS